MSLHRLHQVYLETSYEVHDGDSVVGARIGAPSPELDAVLERHGARGGVFLTAWNPRSEPHAVFENDAANRRLADDLRRAGFRWLPHVGRPDSPDWTPEQGFFVFDLSPEDGLAFAERYGQNAVVSIARGAGAELHYTRIGAARPAASGA